VVGAIVVLVDASAAPPGIHNPDESTSAVSPSSIFSATSPALSAGDRRPVPLASCFSA
jgi:hypothetical protein